MKGRDKKVTSPVQAIGLARFLLWKVERISRQNEHCRVGKEKGARGACEKSKHCKIFRITNVRRGMQIAEVAIVQSEAASQMILLQQDDDRVDLSA